MRKPLKVVLIKPTKYDRLGVAERFRWGFMPNATLRYIKSMTPPPEFGKGLVADVVSVDEYVETNLDYLNLLRRDDRFHTLVALVGTQSNQFHRSIDLAALAVNNGCLAVIGGPHPMTCDTEPLQNKGVSFAQAEVDSIWTTILNDAILGELQPVYGREQRWAKTIDPPPLLPPTGDELRRYVVPMMGVYPARGCPFLCNFCSVIKIAGRQERSQPVETTIKSLRAAKMAGVKLIMFTSDNLNKYPQVVDLLQNMIEENLNLGFFCQCDTQIVRQPELVELLARAGCFQMFVGVESFDAKNLKSVHKGQNRPETFAEIVRLCRNYKISAHFSNIIGFPEQTSGDVEEHVRVLESLGPNFASFFILTPLPGSDQYGEYMEKGLIRDFNLDNFDLKQLVWEHSKFSPAKLEKLLYWCYRSFYRPAPPDPPN